MTNQQAIPHQPRHKADKAETQRRVIDTMRLILAGMTSAVIVENISKQWGLSPQQARVYIRRARALINDEFSQLKEGMIAEHILHRRDVRKRAQAEGDLRAELMAGQDEAKLLGLYPPAAMELSGKGGGPILSADVSAAIEKVYDTGDESDSPR